jgi:N6-adenosine-specific RNA methylase IME4
MTIDEIRALPVPDLAADNCHLWLWCTVRSLPDGFDLVDHWGFRFHNMVTWVKPSGMGPYFINRTQPILFAYRGKLDMRQRFKPNVLFANPGKHSTKPECSYELIEQVSHEPRVELFARRPRDGWTCLGDGIDGMDITQAMRQLSPNPDDDEPTAHGERLTTSPIPAD